MANYLPIVLLQIYLLLMMKTNPQIVWITGASSGIGEALVYAYSQQGAKLIISSRNKERLYEVKTACKRNPLDIHVLPLDLDELDTLPKKVADALNIFGKIDIVIHAGGLSQRSIAMETNLSVIERLMKVNYVSTVAINQALLPSMLAQGIGTKIIQGITKKREEMYVGGKEIYGVWLKRFFPTLFSRFVKTAKVR